MAGFWYPQAIVMLIEHRYCRRCARIAEVSNMNVLVEYRRLANGYPSATKFLRAETGYENSALPRQRRVVEVTVDGCLHCFDIKEPDGQGELFPQDRPKTTEFSPIPDEPFGLQRTPGGRVVVLPGSGLSAVDRAKKKAERPTVKLEDF